ncbi:hypothetical protein [Aminobacter phage Erebus]|nr:hypothetical protein [Aminobacter phage Erebus]
MAVRYMRSLLLNSKYGKFDQEDNQRKRAVMFARYAGLQNTADMWEKMTDEEYQAMVDDAWEREEKIKRSAGRWD